MRRTAALAAVAAAALAGAWARRDYRAWLALGEGVSYSAYTQFVPGLNQLFCTRIILMR
jgi:hypothetical protein